MSTTDLLVRLLAQMTEERDRAHATAERLLVRIGELMAQKFPGQPLDFGSFPASPLPSTGAPDATQPATAQPGSCTADGPSVE